MNIAFIGGRACGKSKVSRRLFYLTKRPLFQLDELIVYEQSGMKIPEIVKKYGWEHFREVEYQVVKKVSKMHGSILDCGGGVIIDLDDSGNEIYSDRKINVLKTNSFIIWLKLDVSLVAEKIENDPDRPNLSDNKSFFEIMERRMPFYKRACDMEFDMKGHTKKSAAAEISNFLNNKGIW